jgi:hypothetical protein
LLLFAHFPNTNTASIIENNICPTTFNGRQPLNRRFVFVVSLVAGRD